MGSGSGGQWEWWGVRGWSRGWRRMGVEGCGGNVVCCVCKGPGAGVLPRPLMPSPASIRPCLPPPSSQPPPAPKRQPPPPQHYLHPIYRTSLPPAPSRPLPPAPSLQVRVPFETDLAETCRRHNVSLLAYRWEELGAGGGGGAGRGGEGYCMGCER